MLDWEIFDGAELLALARLDIEAQRLDAALVKLKRAQRLASYPIEVHAVVAKLYAQLDLFEQAAQHYQQYLEQVPDALLERFQLGMVHFEQRLFDQAHDIWLQVLEASPLHPPALYYTALLQVQRNDSQNARQLLDRLLKTAPMDNLYFRQAKSLLQSMDSNSRDTLENLDLKNSEVLYN